MHNSVAAAEVLARAWNAARLYGIDHAACARALRDLVTAASVLNPAARFVVGHGGLRHADTPLEPASHYVGLAQTLLEGGIAEIEIHRTLDHAAATRLIQLLIGPSNAGGSSGVLSASIAQATGGAVKARGFKANAFARVTHAPTSPQGRREAGPRLHDLASVEHQAGPTRLSAAAVQVLEFVAERRQGAEPSIDFTKLMPAARETAKGDENTEEAGSTLACLDAVFSTLSEHDQSLIIQMLGRDDLASFDDAVAILDRLPVLKLVDAMAVLGRSDGRVSNTSLMLLRRMANLAIGSSTDLHRLSDIAETWSAEATSAAGDAAIDVERTARLLKNVAQTDFRSEEYTAQLRELLGVEGASERRHLERMNDDFSRLTSRAVDIVSQSLNVSIAAIGDQQRASGLEFLRARCPTLADQGELDALKGILALASDAASGTNSAAAAAGAKLLDDVAVKCLMAVALGRCGNAGAIGEHLRAVHPCDAVSAPSLLARAAMFAQTPLQRQAVVEAARGMDRAEILEEAKTLVAADPMAVGALCFLVHALNPEGAVGFVKPSLLGHDAAVRETAYMALAQTAVTWPLDLCVRGLSEDQETVRMMAAEQIARSHLGHASLFVDRLIGKIGHVPVTPGEREHLQRLLSRDASRPTTRRIAWLVVVNAWMPGGGSTTEMLASLLASRPAILTTRAALVARRLSPFRSGRSRKAAA